MRKCRQKDFCRCLPTLSTPSSQKQHMTVQIIASSHAKVNTVPCITYVAPCEVSTTWRIKPMCSWRTSTAFIWPKIERILLDAVILWEKSEKSRTAWQRWERLAHLPCSKSNVTSGHLLRSSDFFSLKLLIFTPFSVCASYFLGAGSGIQARQNVYYELFLFDY